MTQAGPRTGTHAPLFLRVMGPPRIAGDVDVAVTGPRSIALVTLLALHRNAVVSTDRVAQVLWGDRPPGNVDNAIQARVAAVRRAFARAGVDDPIVTEAGGYRLVVPPGGIDVERFERLVADGRRQFAEGNHDAATSSLRAALGSWEGPPWEPLAEDAVASGETTRLEEVRLGAQRLLLTAELHLGRHDEVVAEASRLVDLHPFDEDLHGLLVTALFRAGRQRDALDALATVGRRLREELGVDPGPGLERLHRAVLQQDTGLLSDAAGPQDTGRSPDDPVVAARDTAPAPPVQVRSLPRPLSPLLGRDTDLADLGDLVDHHRLVTLTGPGGIGKTRLAIEVAHRAVDRGEVAGCVVELAPVARSEAVLDAVARALGIASAPTDRAGRPVAPLADRVVQRVRDDDWLVVVDNCEHVLEGVVAAVGLLLDAGAGVRVLATSREALGIPGEHRRPVSPLELPPVAAGDQADLRDAAAVRLFSDRAHDASPAFSLDDESAPLVAELVRRLDGLPLAIELAAARLSSIALPMLVDRLEDRFDLLTGGAHTATRRQQTLEAVIDWSHDLLAPHQRAVFLRLAVFSAPATVDAAEAVCADDDVATASVLPTLAELVDKSLVTLDTTSPSPRYGMLETIRSYARRRLAAAGEAAATQARHRGWYEALATEAWQGLRGADQVPWLDRLGHEHADLSAAIRSAIATAPARAVAMCAHLAWYWWLRDHGREAIDLLTDSIAAARNAGPGQTHEGASDASPHQAPETAPEQAPEQAIGQAPDAPPEVGGPDLAVATAWLAFLALFQGAPPDHVRELLARMEADAASTSLPDEAAMVVGVVGGFVALAAGGDPEEALAAIEAGERHAEAAGDRWAVAAAAFCRAQGLASLGRPDEAAAEARRAVEVAAAVGDRWGQFQAHQWQGVYEAARGHYAAADGHYEVAMELAHVLGLGELAAGLEAQRAMVWMLDGQLDRARRHLEGVLADAADGLPPDAALAHHGLGQVSHRRGDHETAVHHHRVAVELFTRAGEPGACGEARAHVAFSRAALGDGPGAAAAARRALAETRGSGPRSVALAAESAAAAAAALDAPELAVEFLAVGAGLRRAQGLPLVGGERHDVDAVIARIRGGAPEALPARRPDAATDTDVAGLLAGLDDLAARLDDLVAGPDGRSGPGAHDHGSSAG